jgi:cytochrome c oxidase cbb3-type subunit 3
MSSRFRRAEAVLLLAAALLAAACQREKRESRGEPVAENGPADFAMPTIYPGGGSEPPPDPRGAMYEGNAAHIAAGQRWFRWYNCSGCHSNGGGGMGPALMDDQWRYGGRIDQIYATIVQGRPNGMPSFRGKIPDAQVWEIAAYIRTMGGNVDKTAAPSRADVMQNTPPLTQVDPTGRKNSDSALPTGGG